MAVRTPALIPVTIIGGFLGAGKTTLLNHILSEHHGVRGAVLVNDFGAINIDAKLIVGVEGDTVNLANGCICCTIRGDLVGACLGLLQRPEPPEYLFVEMSGVADPVPVLNTFLETELAAVFAFNSILTVADAENLLGLEGEMIHMARTQIAVADIVVLNKIDLVSTDKLERVKQLVHQVSPGSRIIEVTQGRVPLELVFGGSQHAHRKHPEASGQQHEHHHDQVFSTWSWTCDRPLSLPKLRSVLEQLPDTVYRCKGIVCLEELPAFRYVLQMVGKRYHLEESARWGTEPPRSEIVLIGGRDGVDGAKLQRAFEACVGTGDESQSPVLRLARKLGLDAPTEQRRQERDLRKPTRHRAIERR